MRPGNTISMDFTPLALDVKIIIYTDGRLGYTD